MSADNLAHAPHLTPGFADTVTESQQVFRHLLEAMARPGTVQTIDIDLEGPSTLDRAATAIALALVDFETPLYVSPALSTNAAETYLKFHCGTRITDDPMEAAFAILDKAPESLSGFNSGTDEYPENGATLLIQVDTVEAGGPLVLSGPGIKDTTRLDLPDVPAGFWTVRAAQQRYFPRGIDLVFVSGASMVAIPRTTTVSLTAGKE
ncbi:phosphonate C-P lyase system protein PhnH [Nisaea sediminum]|uniref:phosphonate C-P lyase system protein PhnH n=1 Tax=Nisaea sediminum TaxID=2775867 RepID=UPI0018680DBB|nr:phosphonate C-P lyase system protein PhnH [Nisaea sediminum]